MPAQAGDTFLLTGRSVPSPHLWAIVWGPAGAADSYLAVMFATARPHSDRTCILTAGDHPFVRHDTAVDYGICQRWSDEKLADTLASGIARRRQPLSAAVLERIRAGFFASPRTPHAFVTMAVADYGAIRSGYR